MQTIPNRRRRHLTKPAWEDLVDLGVERDNAEPLYRQLYFGLRTAILDRRLRPGTKLPSTRDLAGRVGVARMSVVTAYEQLLAEGYAVGLVGAGTFVSADLPEPVAAGVAEPPGRKRATTPRAARRAERLGVDLEPDATGRVPFGTGFGHVDLCTLDAWRKLTIRAMREPGRVDLGYSDPQGLPDLRLALCATSGRHGAYVASPNRSWLPRAASRRSISRSALHSTPAIRSGLRTPAIP
jgi:GntR family transcriptional regulator / MocR family aminotransferase